MDDDVVAALRPFGQEHLLAFASSLSEPEQRALSAQIAELDLPHLQDLIRDYVLRKPDTVIPQNLQPAPYFPAVARSEDERAYYARAVVCGKELLRAGKVSFLTVAGGQGSRLGFDGPKGTFPIAPVSFKSLFQYFAETIGRLNEKYETQFVWYIMTSRLNDRATRDFFQSHNFFGLKPENIVFFAQGTMPAIGYDGKLLLSDKGHLALAPDGHGGTLLALRRSGALERMQRENVDYVSYFQVDNPLVQFADPLFIGLHHLENAELSARSLTKTGPFEKLGNFCMIDGKLNVIEYSDMPEALAQQRDADGQLTFRAGSPAMHVISRAFIERLTESGRLNLPWHRADKKVPYVNAQGEKVEPSEPNAVKLESFIFDAIPMARKTVILEAVREDSFAPTKNKTGVDSVESCRAMMSDRDTRWLKAAGVKVPLDAVVELSMRACVDVEDVRAYAARPDFKAPEPGNNYYQ